MAALTTYAVEDVIERLPDDFIHRVETSKVSHWLMDDPNYDEVCTDSLYPVTPVDQFIDWI